MIAPAVAILTILAGGSSWAMEPRSARDEMLIRYHIEKGEGALLEDVQRNPEYTAAIKRKRGFESRMGITLDSDGNPFRAPTESELQRLNGWFHDDRDEYRRVATIVASATARRDSHFNKAIALVLDRQGIIPSYPSGPVRHNAPAGSSSGLRAFHLSTGGPSAGYPSRPLR